MARQRAETEILRLRLENLVETRIHRVVGERRDDGRSRFIRAVEPHQRVRGEEVRGRIGGVDRQRFSILRERRGVVVTAEEERVAVEQVRDDVVRVELEHLPVPRRRLGVLLLLEELSPFGDELPGIGMARR